MRQLHKIKLKHYYKLNKQDQDSVDLILKEGLKENDVLRIGRKSYKPQSLWNISYSQMLYLKDNLHNEYFIDCIAIVYGVHSYHLNESLIYNLIAVYKSIIESLNKVLDIEKTQFDNKTEPDEEKAGIKNFNKYGSYNELRSLTGGDRKQDEFWLNLPYKDVFIELSYKNDLIKFEKELSKAKK